MLLTDFETVNLGPLNELLSKQYDGMESRFAGIEMIPSFIMSAAFALEEFPSVNGNNNYINVGIKNGDLHFMIKDANKRDMGQIEDDIIRTIKSKRVADTWNEEETFSIINTGMLEEDIATTIIEHSVSAVMGIHSIHEKPYTFSDKKVADRPCMDISLTYKADVITKEDARDFLMDMKDLLENPEPSDE